MFSLQFHPTNDAAQSTFSQVVCARQMTASVLEPHMGEIRQARDKLACLLRQLIIRIEEQGEVVGAIAQDSAFAQLEPAVESNGGRVFVRLPVASAARAHEIGQQLLERFKAASLGRGQWSLEVSSVARMLALSNAQHDYFGWRVSLPLCVPAIGPDYSMAEVEDGLHDAIYGALLAQAATGNGVSVPPYPGNLHVTLDNVQELRFGDDEGVVDLHHARFSANVVGASGLFLGVDLMDGSGLIELAKSK